MAAEIGPPHRVHTAQDVVDTLLRGNWAILAHEWADGIDPEHWQDVVEAAAEAAGVDVEFVVIPRRSLTVVFNRAAPPTFAQVRASIEVIERHR
ncbi:hypothetical protein H4696_007050 [Amycolatopsis lexingtonensis]|uniref:Uncharacterized protein n=1 Tax=Amycolatopsis lexingtonensis TaxID=218822 RepID=A0ABR9I9T8_9PSEU|nr:hypothetical protein [Amycolatopsis lexingtonensis]MBE1499950.1 hypothetical protein [Amycolatopsis lexingtonensis]